ncbi:UNVERIFIED_CONTAM: hypothetical protein PYX00_010750 [Menopon gallinae]|uniref:C2H2-type domain-containing protein n=1 Tax=Menopon gallinae TaxID=328185 RepID=A0AAW2HHL1_9NEOP
MSRHRSGLKKAPPEIGLHMECIEEELEPCQVVHYNKAETEYNEIQNKLDNYLTKMKAEVIEKGENCVVLQLNVSTSNNIGNSTQVSPASTGKVTRQSVQSTQNYQQVVGQGILTRSSSNNTANAYLVMDPRLGLVVGQVPQNSVNSENTSPTKHSTGTRTRSTPGSVMVTTRARSGVKKGNNSESEVLSSGPGRTREKGKGQQVQQPVPPATIQQVYTAGKGTTTPTSYRIKVNVKPLPPQGKPCESNALGGLMAGSKNPWKPNSEDGGNKANAADSKEVTFNKMSGKTFPSLVVAARPHLRLKYIPQATITQERTALDAKVKGVLMYIPSTFTEWLIQEGLIRNEQYCQIHVNHDLTPVKFKLGIYRDVSKFPYSGGYIWIPPCCTSHVVSVFSGSIFEGAPHPPTTILKLIYHWACQTNVQNVVQWVKVDNLYVKNFFTNMRAVCTQALHQKHQKIGGPRSKIEVGMISLGTTSQDGNMRQVKVEVLGVMDAENKLIRLRALEPLSEEKNFKRRFVKILEPLEEWVHKESTIFTDFTIDKGTLINMGFRTVYQVSANDRSSKYSNQNVMEYLRRIVPRMFQNTLSLLSRQIIQQFLDELVWREMWGAIPSQAFDMIISHIAEQTKLDASESLLCRLNKVASNPFKNWNYSVWKPAPITTGNTKPCQMTADIDSIPLFNRLATVEDGDAGSSAFKSIRTRKRAMDQSVESPTVSPAPAKKTPKFAGKDKIKKEEKPKFLETTFKKETPEKDKAMITEEIVAFINNKTAQIPLDSYYYGTKDGDVELISSEYKGLFRVRCSVCNTRFDDNIDLMKHMILHAQLEPPLAVAINFAQQCDHCFLGFQTAIELKEHMDQVHPSSQNATGSVTECRICEESFTNRVELIFHMHRSHVQLELPYECGVCHYRTSIFKMIVDHFVQVHKGGEHVLCPFCLKVVAFAYKGKYIPNNVRFYENHLEKHSRTALTRKCHRCKLSFIHKGIFDQHIEADHFSFKEESGVKAFENSPNTIMMPEPGVLIKPATAPKSLKMYRARPLFSCNRFKALEIHGIDDDMACIECEGSLEKPEHFTGYLTCLKCRYATCCEKAMAEHTTIFHESPTLQFSIGKPTVLQNAMFCACGYSCYSGNKLAKHIVLCERKCAYSSEEAANAAAAALAMIDESPPTPQQQGESQNMLNMLGLMRKSPEAGSICADVRREEYLDDAPSVECSQGSQDKQEEHDSEGEEASKTEDEIKVEAGLATEVEKGSDVTVKDDSHQRDQMDDIKSEDGEDDKGRTEDASNADVSAEDTLGKIATFSEITEINGF